MMITKMIRSLILVLLSYSFIQNGLAAPFNTKILDSGVVRIEIRLPGGVKITGSGFLINRDGYVLTNYHVIKRIIGASNVEYFVYDGNIREYKRKKFRVIWYTSKHDIALLKVENIDKARHPVILADSENDTITKGMHVWTLGFPAASDTAGAISLEPILKDGVISIKRDMTLVYKAPSTKMYEHSAAINGGNSGGPLLDNCGFVIGMNQSKASPVLVAQGTFWSIRSAELIKVLRQQNIKFHLTTVGCRSSTVIDSNESYQSLLRQLNSNRNRWRLFTLMLVGVFTLLLAVLFWWKYKTKTSHEGVSQFVRRELSRILRHRDASGMDSSLTGSASGERMTIMANRQDITFGIVVGCGTMQGRQCIIRGAPILVGRGREADMRIKDERVGRRHLKLGWDQAQRNFYLEDLGSVNGTWLSEDRKIEPGSRYYLQAGVEFCIADPELVFKIELPEAETVTAPTINVGSD